MTRSLLLVLCLAACGGTDPTAAASCPYAHAPGVIDTTVSGGQCVYACAQPDGGVNPVREWCGTACVPLDTVANCGECGRTCSGASPRCQNPPTRGTAYCTGP